MSTEALEKPANAPPERNGDYSRLSNAEIGAALQLHKVGRSQTEIAETLKCHRSTICRLLKDLEPTTEIAKLTAQHAALDLMKRVIKDADVEESLEVLDRIDVLPKRQSESGPQIQIIQGITLTGMGS